MLITKGTLIRHPSAYMFEIEDSRLKDGELRRCPFCNGEAKIEQYINVFYVRCTRCGAQTWNKEATNEEQASLTWNLRLGR